MEVYRSLLLKSFKNFLTQLKDLANRKSNIYIFDPFPVICPRQKNCANYLGPIRTFSDDNHLSREGSKLLYENFLGFLKREKLIDKNKLMKFSTSGS